MPTPYKPLGCSWFGSSHVVKGKTVRRVWIIGQNENQIEPG